ncbi:hypothetical protein POVWA1_021730 [Plasmodium ovale wallikeri]|uniref:Uncharacterized protein n=1 Tax=Plasmodium ovale wallikeri TaxID=864142 RepID=A0A1A8YRR6_PLAOA|nr:hypothetical protein POVWA1_021730 [Plasmodium ovale wallikeri]
MYALVRLIRVPLKILTSICYCSFLIMCAKKSYGICMGQEIGKKMGKARRKTCNEYGHQAVANAGQMSRKTVLKIYTCAFNVHLCCLQCTEKGNGEKKKKKKKKKTNYS